MIQVGIRFRLVLRIAQHGIMCKKMLYNLYNLIDRCLLGTRTRTSCCYVHVWDRTVHWLLTCLPSIQANTFRLKLKGHRTTHTETKYVFVIPVHNYTVRVQLSLCYSNESQHFAAKGESPSCPALNIFCLQNGREEKILKLLSC